MNLTLFFRLITISIFQSQVTYDKKNYGAKMSYDNKLFFCPVVYAKDGFYVSLQIDHSNYCSSENGYRKLGHTFSKVEFGFPSENDDLLRPYSEIYDESDIEYDITGTVGSVPILVLEELFEKRGGIDWEKTISKEVFEKFVNED